MSDELRARIESAIRDAMDPSMTGDACRRAVIATLLDQIDIAGFAIVPKEPTDEMVRAGAVGSGEDSDGCACGAWDAMIAAAPKVQG